MNRIYVLFSVFLLSFATALGQTVDLQKVVARYGKANGVTAKVVRVEHKTAVAQDDKATGEMTIARPDRMTISVCDGKEMLRMDGNDFIMLSHGREHKTSSTKNRQFVAFQSVLTAIIQGDASRLSGTSGVNLSQSGNTVTIVMDPTEGDAAKKRMMFTSFVLTLDARSGELRTLRMNGRGSNYTEYQFSGFAFK